MLFSHTVGDLGIGHATCGGQCVVASVMTDLFSSVLPAGYPIFFMYVYKFLLSLQCHFVAISLAWLPVVWEKSKLLSGTLNLVIYNYYYKYCNLVNASNSIKPALCFVCLSSAI